MSLGVSGSDIYIYDLVIHKLFTRLFEVAGAYMEGKAQILFVSLRLLLSFVCCRQKRKKAHRQGDDGREEAGTKQMK